MAATTATTVTHTYTANRPVATPSPALNRPSRNITRIAKGNTIANASWSSTATSSAAAITGPRGLSDRRPSAVSTAIPAKPPDFEIAFTKCAAHAAGSIDPQRGVSPTARWATM